MKIRICGGTIFDGSGAEPYKGDLLIEDGLITDVRADAISCAGAEVIDASGMTVTPGFIDIHRHCDIAPMRDPRFGDIELAQGITTAVAGNCGLAPVPVSKQYAVESAEFLRSITGPASGYVFEGYDAYFHALEESGPPINIGVLAGSGAIKTCVKGFGSSQYTQSELERAAGYVAEAVKAGVFGVSLGIMYPPECYSEAGEIARVIAPAAKAGGVLTAHIRGEGDLLVESVREVISIAKTAGIRLHISHFKATGIRNWSTAIHKAIEEIENARASGLTVTVDFYPYDGGATTLLSLIPPSLLSKGDIALNKLSVKEAGILLESELAKTHSGWENMAESIRWDRILVSSVTKPENETLCGRKISELALEQGISPPEFVAGLLASEGPGTGIIVLSMSSGDIDTVAKLPYSAVISDALYGGGLNPHPRLLGTHPKLLREYVRERGVLTMSEAVRKMTSFPAEILGIGNRGLLKPGYIADINIFNPKEFRDNAQYTGAKEPACGMSAVLLGGRVAYADGLPADKKFGSILRRKV